MKRLDSYHIMIVSQYFSMISDFINLETVCKKFYTNLSKFHFNPIPITHQTLKHFPAIETLNLWSSSECNFGNTFMSSNQQKEHTNMLNSSLEPIQHNTQVHFYKVNVWYIVPYSVVDMNKTNNFVFKRVSFSNHDASVFGSKIPPCVTRLDESCFFGSLIIEIDIPSKVTSIGINCFGACFDLMRVTMPKYLSVLERGAFFSCSKLSAINILSGIEVLERWTFNGCKNLNQIEIPFGVTKIGENCFDGCEKLTNVVISKSVKIINNNCFINCKRLKQVVIPLSVEKLNLSSFDSSTRVCFEKKGCVFN
uniref:Leucine rich repeat containing protein BspA family protein n=1 Tax=Entamoeba invadens TaxID=33085 RepID=S0B3X8_ENTIV|nr:hypothetical protein [Entamoeba invadens]